jgi:hypothetical protein
MIAMTVIMYCLSIIHLAFSFKINLVALFDQKAAQTQSKSLENTENIFACTPIAAETLNCILGDSVVIWRTWVIWNRNRRVIYFPCALLLGGIVASVLVVRAMFMSFSEPTLFNANTKFTMGAFCVLTTMINVYAIIAIGYRVWVHGQAMKAFSGQSHGIFSRLAHGYLDVFLIFLESGFIYCIVPISTMILFGTSNNGVFITIGILSQMTGIYPTAIIVLVCLKLTQHDNMTRTQASSGENIAFHHSNLDPNALTTDTLSSFTPSYGMRPISIQVHENQDPSCESSKAMV